MRVDAARFHALVGRLQSRVVHSLQGTQHNAWPNEARETRQAKLTKAAKGGGDRSLATRAAGWL